MNEKKLKGADLRKMSLTISLSHASYHVHRTSLQYISHMHSSESQCWYLWVTHENCRFWGWNWLDLWNFLNPFWGNGEFCSPEKPHFKYKRLNQALGLHRASWMWRWNDMAPPSCAKDRSGDEPRSDLFLSAGACAGKICFGYHLAKNICVPDFSMEQHCCLQEMQMNVTRLIDWWIYLSRYG